MGLEDHATTRVGFIGAGQMAEAVARGLVKAGTIPADRIFASKGSRKATFESFGVTVCSNSEVVNRSNVVIIAVKPQILKTVLTELSPLLTKDHLLVSIAAGITIESLQSWGGDVRVVRVMPNSPCLVGECAAALSAGSSSTQGDMDLVKLLFDAIGTTVVVEEKYLNAVTGVSGSGPAFVYVAIEAMADGGVAAGLPRGTALSLAAQTFLGAAKMVLETNKHPGQLKDEVASPGGTTIAGLHELEKAGFRAAWMNAVLAATKRGEQLAGSSKNSPTTSIYVCEGRFCLDRSNSIPRAAYNTAARTAPQPVRPAPRLRLIQWRINDYHRQLNKPVYVKTLATSLFC